MSSTRCARSRTATPGSSAPRSSAPTSSSRRSSTASTSIPTSCGSSGALAGGRIALVTDAIAGAGLGDGTYALGETEIVVADDVVRREDGVLAGSALTMPQAVRNLVAVGVPLEDALAAASTVPARVLGRTDVGRLVPGGPADVVVLDDALEVVADDRRRRDACRRLRTAASPGTRFLAEIREQPAALRRLLEHDAEIARIAQDDARPRRAARPPRRPRLVGQRRLVRRLRVRAAAALDGDARLDHAHRPLRHSRST